LERVRFAVTDSALSLQKADLGVGAAVTPLIFEFFFPLVINLHTALFLRPFIGSGAPWEGYLAAAGIPCW